jgi:hypothetical protein
VNPETRIAAGLPREEALRLYESSVNQADTLFAYLPSLPMKLDLMRALLHDPISADEAYALNDVLYRRLRFTDMVAWLKDEPISWDGYFVREEFRAEEADRQLIEEWRQEAEDRANGIESQREKLWDMSLPPEVLAEINANSKAGYLPRAHPCPDCGTPAEFLEWSRPGVNWQTRCRFCLCKVDEFIDVLVTPSRRLKRPAALFKKRDVPM